MNEWAFKTQKSRGFTIVELLIVIVVIGILAAITIVAYSGIQTRAAGAKRDADISEYYKAILIARQNTGKTLGQITGNYWSAGSCVYNPGSNTGNVEPRDLPKTNTCWTTYYDNLAKIGAASGMSLDGLKTGDSRGDPYLIDENEGEQGNCGKDAMFYFIGNGTADVTAARTIPTFQC